MTNSNKRWYSSRDMQELGIQDFELLDAVKAGKLTPYNKESGKKVIDLETAEGMMTPEEIEKIWRHGESRKVYHNEDPAVVVTCHKDFDVEFDGFELQRVLGYIYKVDEVRDLLEQLGHKSNLPGPSMKKRPVQEDKERAIEIARNYINGCKANAQTPRIVEAEKLLKKHFRKMYTGKKTYHNWIKDIFPPESRKPGRPKNTQS